MTPGQRVGLADRTGQRKLLSRLLWSAGSTYLVYQSAPCIFALRCFWTFEIEGRGRPLLLEVRMSLISEAPCRDSQPNRWCQWVPLQASVSGGPLILQDVCCPDLPLVIELPDLHASLPSPPPRKRIICQTYMHISPLGQIHSLCKLHITLSKSSTESCYRQFWGLWNSLFLLFLTSLKCQDISKSFIYLAEDCLKRAYISD